MPLRPNSLLGRSRHRRIEFIAKRQSKAVRGHLSNASCGGSPTKVYGSIPACALQGIAARWLSATKL